MTQNFNMKIAVLRIVSCLLVIVSHLVCLVVYDNSYAQWNSANALYIIRSSCVPTFLAITGILLLKKNVPFKKAYCQQCDSCACII